MLESLLEAEGLQLYQKKNSTQVFFDEVCEMFKNNFFYKTSLVTATAPMVAVSAFFKKSN